MRARRTTLPIRFVTFTALASAVGGSVVSCGTPAETTDGHAPAVVSALDEPRLSSSLTRAEVRTVLKLVDDTCGDTWCEGDFAYRFRNLFCDAESESCTLTFQMAPSGEAPLDWRWRTCRTGGFLGFESLVNTASGGYQWLATTYYQALNDCIDALETSGAEP
jgi:hypothetical protein